MRDPRPSRSARPDDFFAAAEAEYPDAPVWSGEMYLELHRGVYTSQLRTKQGNRRSEHLLREAELWAATAAVRRGSEYPYDALERAWRTVLLLQFHDILPGSAIAWVHREAEQKHAAVAVELEAIIARSMADLAGDGTVRLEAHGEPVGPHAQAMVVELVESDSVGVHENADGWTLSTARVSVTVGRDGSIRSLRGPIWARCDPCRCQGRGAANPPRPPESVGRLGPRRPLQAQRARARHPERRSA